MENNNKLYSLTNYLQNERTDKFCVKTSKKNPKKHLSFPHLHPQPL